MNQVKSSNKLGAAGVLLSSLCFTSLATPSRAIAQDNVAKPSTDTPQLPVTSTRLTGEAERVALRLVAEKLSVQEPVMYAVLQDSLAFMKGSPESSADTVATRMDKVFRAISAGRAEALVLGNNTNSFEADLRYARGAVPTFNFHTSKLVGATDRGTRSVRVTPEAWYEALVELSSHGDTADSIFTVLERSSTSWRVVPTKDNLEWLWKGHFLAESISKETKRVINTPDRIITGSSSVSNELGVAREVLTSELLRLLQKESKAIDALSSLTDVNQLPSARESFRVLFDQSMEDILARIADVRILSASSNESGEKSRVSIAELDGLRDLILIADGAVSVVLGKEVEEWLNTRQQIVQRVDEILWKIKREGESLPTESDLTVQQEVAAVTKLLNLLLRTDALNAIGDIDRSIRGDFAELARTRIRSMGFSSDFASQIGASNTTSLKGTDFQGASPPVLSLEARGRSELIGRLSPLVGPMQIGDPVAADALAAELVKGASRRSRASRLSKDTSSSDAENGSKAPSTDRDASSQKAGQEFRQFLNLVLPVELQAGELAEGTPDIRVWMTEANDAVALLSHMSEPARASVRDEIHSLVVDSEALVTALLLLDGREVQALPLEAQGIPASVTSSIAKYERVCGDLTLHLSELKDGITRAIKQGRFKDLGKAVTVDKLQLALKAELAEELKAAAGGRQASSSIFNKLISAQNRAKFRSLVQELGKHKAEILSGLSRLAPLRIERYVEVAALHNEIEGLPELADVSEVAGSANDAIENAIGGALRKAGVARAGISALQAPYVRPEEFLGHAITTKVSVEALADKLRILSAE